MNRSLTEPEGAAVTGLANVTCLADLVGIAANRAPSFTAIEHDTGRLNYAEFWDRVQRCAAALSGLGLPHGARVAMFSKNCHAYLETYLALQLAGLVAVPVNFRLSADELVYIVKNSGASALFVSEALFPLVQPRRKEIGLSEDDIIVYHGTGRPNGYDAFIDRADPQTQVRPAASPLSNAMIFYTSGTTGFPKGAVQSHVGILSRFSSWAWRYGITEEEVIYVPGPIFHQSFGSISLVSLAVGARVVLREDFDATTTLKDFADHGVTWSFLVPNMLQDLLKAAPTRQGHAGFPALRGIMTSGSRLEKQTVEAFEAAFPGTSLADAYGWTESGWITYCRHADILASDRSVGRASFGCEIAILDEQGRHLAPGEIGGIHARNPVPFVGYHDNPDATAGMRHGTWESGGDMGYIDKDGFLHLVDRKHDMIISGGENIYPAEIERVVSEHPEVEEVAVVGVADETWGEHPRVCIVLRDGAELTLQDVIAFCDGRLARYKLPRSLRVIDALPRNNMGKVLRRNLRAQFQEEDKT